MPTVTVLANPLDPSDREIIETDDVLDFIHSRWASWPPTGRIYRGAPSAQNDITPACTADVERLAQQDGPITIIVYPEDPITIIVAVVAVAITAAATFLLRPNVPDLSNRTASSGNNDLSDRSNRPRINGRIPDIYGTVRSVPDLLSVPYRVYENHRELEISYLCIGRGSYEIEDIRDGDTLVENIAGASLAIYGPQTSPNNPSDTPQLEIGAPISDPVFNVTRLGEVNGQVLRAPNDVVVRASEQIIFADGGIIQAASGSGIDFTDFFEVDDDIVVGGADTSGVTTPSTAIFAAAIATTSGQLIFSTYNPSTDWAAGDFMTLDGAVWTTPDHPGGGDVSGGGSSPNYRPPYWNVPEQ